ncbi:MAG: hypothetical protein ABR880_23200 [Candidatus Sulfotelmatobacter sp.]|jgi:hypothetical protein
MTTDDIIRELEAEVAGRSNRHRLNGTAPHDVGFVFHSRSRLVREPTVEWGQQSFVYQSYPRNRVHIEMIRQTLKQVSGGDWQYVGRVFCYWEPDGDVHFQARPTPEFGADKWEELLNCPVYLGNESGIEQAGVTFREKIMCRFARRSYEDFLAAGWEREMIRRRWDEPLVEAVAE